MFVLFCHTRQSNNASEHGDDNDDDDDDNDSLLLTSIPGGWPDALEKDIPLVPYIDKLCCTLLYVFV